MVARTTKIYGALRGAGFFQRTEPANTPRDHPSDDRPFKLSWALRWAPAPLAIAASLLIGVLIGVKALPHGNGFSLTPFATASVSFIGPESAVNGVPEVKIESNFRGFVTVIGLSSGAPDRATVLPLPPEDDLLVEPGKPANTGPLAAEARNTKTAVVVTKSPAAEILDRALLEKKYSTDQMGELEGEIKRVLKLKGFEQVAFSRITF